MAKGSSFKIKDNHIARKKNITQQHRRFVIDSTLKFDVKIPLISHRLQKVNPRGKDKIDLTSNRLSRSMKYR